MTDENVTATESETPAAAGETPAAESETPAAAGETPAAESETPAEGDDEDDDPTHPETRLRKLEDQFEKLRAKLCEHGIHF